LPKTQDAEALKDELLNFEIKITDADHDTYGAFKIGTHDDLTIALGFGVFYSENSVTPGIMAL
jgi:hypothetical protein